MNSKARIVGCACMALVMAAGAASAAELSTFQNLNFESVTQANEFAPRVLTEWQNSQPYGLGIHLSSLPFFFVTPALGWPDPPYEGSHSLVMGAGVLTPASGPQSTIDVSIEQQGTLEEAARSVWIRASKGQHYHWYDPYSPDHHLLCELPGSEMDPLCDPPTAPASANQAWRLFIGGVNIEMKSMGPDLYAGNIPPQVQGAVTLKLTSDHTYAYTPPNSMPNEWSTVVYDDLQFSTMSVPEPAAAALGLIAMGAWRVRRYSPRQYRLLAVRK